ncbi:MAG TPA: potassium channel protein [Polyangiales bacterium]
MANSGKRMISGAIFLLATSVIGTIGYMLSGWGFLDAMYMVVITIFGVGYGEVRHLESAGLRLFTMGFIIAGCSSLVYIMGGFFQMITEGEINRALGKHRMNRTIASLRDHVIICGFGRIGRILVRELTQAGKQCVVIDPDAARSQEAQSAGALVLEGDASQDAVLRSAGIERAVALATVLPNDALNVFITLTARALNAELRIISRGEDPLTEPKLRQAGADEVVLPATSGGLQIAEHIVRPAILSVFEDAAERGRIRELAKLGVGIRAMRIPKDSRGVGRSVSELERLHPGVLVISIRRRDGTVLTAPSPRDQFADDDEILLMAHDSALPSLTLTFPARSRELYHRGTKHIA